MPEPTLSTFNGIEYRNLIKEFGSPIFSSRPDGMSCTRLYSVQWADAYPFQLALRGMCKIEGTGAAAYFSRTTPDNFLWGLGAYPYVCTSVPQIKPEGLYKDAAGNLDTTVMDVNTNIIVPCAKAHMTAEYEVKRFPLAEDDETNEPVLAADETSTSLPFNEWDRYCEWTMEWGVETLTAPIGSYKYVDFDLPLNNYVQFQTQIATITCRVFGLPIMPPGAFKYPGTVNHKAFTFFLDQDQTFFTCEAETLLMQPAGVEFGVQADTSVSYNMIYRFIYRPQKHNFFFYYPGTGGGSGSGSGSNRWSWRRIAKTRSICWPV